MSLTAYELSFLKPILVRNHRLISKQGYLLRIDDENLTTHGDISPLVGFSAEKLQEIAHNFEKIPLHKFIDKISIYLEDSKNLENFKKNKFLDYDFSSWTEYPSLQFALCCALSELFRLRHKIDISGKIRYQGLLQGDSQEMITKSIQLENNGFEIAKVKVGTKTIDEDIQILKNLIQSTQNLKFRIDANQNLSLEEAKKIFKSIDIRRIDYIEEPLKIAKDLSTFYKETNAPFALDENIDSFKNIHLNGLKAIVIKPTVVGDFKKITQLISAYQKIYGKELQIIFSSSYESQLGIYHISQMALSLSPLSTHGLDTFNCFLEEIIEIETINDYIFINNLPALKGPLYV